MSLIKLFVILAPLEDWIWLMIGVAGLSAPAEKLDTLEQAFTAVGSPVVGSVMLHHSLLLYSFTDYALMKFEYFF
jgi:hypothetical protein